MIAGFQNHQQVVQGKKKLTTEKSDSSGVLGAQGGSFLELEDSVDDEAELEDTSEAEWIELYLEDLVAMVIVSVP